MVAVLVTAIFVFTGGSDGPVGDVIDDALGDDEPDTPKTPAFDFKLADPKVVTTAPTPEKEAAKKVAKAKAAEAAAPAAKAVADVLDALYTEAYLDPANWQEGSYGAALSAFSKEARAQAQDRLKLLTAGTDVSAFESIQPAASSLKTHVLLDQRNVPLSVVGTIKFKAVGVEGSTRSIFTSRGDFLLQKVDGEWTIMGFDVTRADKQREVSVNSAAPSTPSSSESAS